MAELTDEEKAAQAAEEAEKKAAEASTSDDKDEGDKKKAPETVPYHRLQEVIKDRNELRSRLEKNEETQKKADEKKLEEDGNFKDLNAKLRKELEDMQSSLNSQQMDIVIKHEIGKLVDITDPAKRQGNIDAISRLMDRTGITLTDGQASGAIDAIKAVEKGYPELFKIGEKAKPDPEQVNQGTPGNPNFAEIKGDDVAKMTPEQLAEYGKHLTGVDPAQPFF